MSCLVKSLQPDFVKKKQINTRPYRQDVYQMDIILVILTLCANYSFSCRYRRVFYLWVRREKLSLTNSHSRDVIALCGNTAGSYACACKAGFTGDGKTCSGKLLWQCEKLLSKRFKCDSMPLYLLYSLSTRKNVKKKEKEKETKMDMT